MTLPLLGWAEQSEIEQGFEDLLAAASRLETHGWVQNSYSNGDACCAAGAVNMVTNEGVYHDPFVRARQFNSRSAIACGIFYRIFGQDIVTFSDGDSQTAKRVIDKIRNVVASGKLQLQRELASS